MTTWNFANCLSNFFPTTSSHFEAYHLVFLSCWVYLFCFFNKHFLLVSCVGEMHLFSCYLVISRIVGATYYQQSACFLALYPLILLKQQYNCLPKWPNLPSFHYIARAFCICFSQQQQSCLIFTFFHAARRCRLWEQIPITVSDCWCEYHVIGGFLFCFLVVFFIYIFIDSWLFVQEGLIFSSGFPLPSLKSVFLRQGFKAIVYI